MPTNTSPISLIKYDGGLSTNRPATELEYNKSPDLDNIIIMDSGFKKRNGDSLFNSTAMNSGANVQGMTYFKPVSGTEYLVAVCGAKIYKSEMDGTMDDISGAIAPTAGQDKIWTFVTLNDLCIGFGGAPDAPFKWSGSGNCAALGGSPPTADFAFSMKDRIFAGIKSTSTLYWPVLSNPEDWTGAGSGSQVVITNDGDTLIGGIPLNNETALLFKNYSIYKLTVQTAPFPLVPLVQGVGCCGKNAMVNVGGMVYFITNSGRMKSTDGYTIYDFPDDIDPIWDTLYRTRMPYVTGIYDPVNDLIHWVCSTGENSANNYDIIWDLKKKCWTRNTTGWKCNVVCLVQGYRIFGGHTNGKIYEKMKSGIYTDASESAGIRAYWRTGWIDLQNKFMVKQVRYADIICKIQSSGSLKYSYGYNYVSDTQSGIIMQAEIQSGIWGVGKWGSTFIWGGKSYVQKRIFFFGIGNNFQIKLYNEAAGEQMEVANITLAVKAAGTAEITR